MATALRQRALGRKALLVGLCVTLGVGTRSHVRADQAPKNRVIVLTDIGGDPDDQQSMVRLLVYANEFDLEGLVATALKDDVVNPQMIHERIDAYAKCYGNLTRHAPGYPTPERLHSLVKSGCTSRMMEHVGRGKSTEGSRHIVDVVDSDDPRPVWVTVWGAATDLAQALWDVKDQRSAEEAARFVAKLRVYDIAGQDDSGAWICHTFPEIFYVRSTLQFQAISVRAARPFPPEVTGANIETFTSEWVEENVMSHGPLGALYPQRKWKYEGDTPAFLYLLPHGLSDPEAIDQGNWGGRFHPVKIRNAGAFNKTCAEAQKKFRPFAMFTEAADTWSWGEHVYEHSTTAPVFRWREEFQNDFAARMDWSVTPRYEDANHPPIVRLNGYPGVLPAHVTMKEKTTIELSAVGTLDPDGDALAYRWWCYREPGTYRGPLEMSGADSPTLTVKAPDVFSPTAIHLILTVRDQGDPPLHGYRRVILTVNPI